MVRQSHSRRSVGSSITKDPTTAFIIILVTMVMVLPSSANPTYHQSSNTDPASADSWWFNACGHNGIFHHEHRKHHNASDKISYNAVRRQMKIFNDFFKKEWEIIKEMYAEVETFEKYESKSFNWLPSYNPPKQRRRPKILQKFHADLQAYVVAVNYLKELSINTKATFNWSRRNDTLFKVFTQIKNLICEVETAMNATGHQVLKRIPPNYPEKHGLGKEINTLSEMYLRDWGVLHKLEKFIKEWNKNRKELLLQNDSDDDFSNLSDNSDISSEHIPDDPPEYV